MRRRRHGSGTGIDRDGGNGDGGPAAAVAISTPAAGANIFETDYIKDEQKAVNNYVESVESI